MTDVIRGKITVNVVRGGHAIKQIERPLHVSPAGKTVVYKGKKWFVLPGDRIVIDGPTADVLPSDGPEGGGKGGTLPAGGLSKDRPELDLQRANSKQSEPTVQAKSPATDAATPVPEEWDPQQLEVIRASAAARFLVDAGPGTGKTAVACRRVAWLIDECGVEPSNIWLISFTKTAVREIRSRIGLYLREPGALWSVRIATLDSHSWAIQSGFDSKASLKGSYEENIARVRELVQNHEGVFEYLASVEHMVIDEAQDIVGVRADLLVDLVERLPSGCGVTVFADEAQAIYGFADDDADGDDEPGREEKQGHLPGRLRAGPGVFIETSLSAIYRTDSKKLKRLFTEVRQMVLTPARDVGADRLAQVTDMVRALADNENAAVKELSTRSEDALRQTFVLFRRRVDALTAASYWGLEPHRIRMSALPACLEPWIGAVFWDWTGRRINRLEFEQRWLDRVRGWCADRTPSNAWEMLVKIAGESATTVSLPLLRSRLGRSAPPSQFVRADFGLGGPVFGTIHGCKGREADCVLLMLPATQSKTADHDEEAKVVFVGATRARAELRVGSGYKFVASRRVPWSGRAYSPKTANDKLQAQVEFGRVGDLTPEGVAGQSLFKSPDDVAVAQQWSLAHSYEIVPAAGEADPVRDWRYAITPTGGPVVGYLSEQVNKDLFSIGRDLQTRLNWSRKLRPNYGPRHLKSFGACTLVLAPDHSEKGLLHEPWATSGFMVAPVVQGFDMIYFRS
jgi:hypothetical protein